ncbi:MAG: hypothetical protein PHI81_04475 [Synergistaceae bacterium]|nr:hypothetical protein [Synergistaceae bacterium]
MIWGDWSVILSSAKDLFLTFKATPDSSLALRMTASQVLHFVQDDRVVCHPEEPQATKDLGLTLKAWNQILH